MRGKHGSNIHIVTVKWRSAIPLWNVGHGRQPEKGGRQQAGADFVVGPIGIIAADALLGEITPKMAQAVASCTAQKVLLPVNTCMFHVVGVSDNRLSDNIDEAISYILQNKQQNIVFFVILLVPFSTDT